MQTEREPPHRRSFKSALARQTKKHDANSTGEKTTKANRQCNPQNRLPFCRGDKKRQAKKIPLKVAKEMNYRATPNSFWNSFFLLVSIKSKETKNLFFRPRLHYSGFLGVLAVACGFWRIFFALFVRKTTDLSNNYVASKK